MPFGGYKLSEKRYDKLNLNIHDHFFAKALDKVRPGGVIAFVTSKGTLDKQNSKFREYLAERADLLGAIRLPNTAFKANAGTEVTSDIIFLQKRESLAVETPEWVKVGKYSDKISVNQYFLDNPDMMLGTMSNESGLRMYGGENSTTCVPFEGAELSEQLKAAITNIKGKIPEYEHDENIKMTDTLPADDNVRNYSYTLVDDKLYYRENSLMYAKTLPKATEERIKGMVELRDTVRELINMQLVEDSNNDIFDKQFELNTLYDKFTKKYGLLNDSANRNAFKDDSGCYLLASLEHIDEHGKLERKADMFTKRTIRPRNVVNSVDTASEALAVSIAEKARVDLDFMSELSSLSKERIVDDLQGVIYRVPKHSEEAQYVTADEYLSGNVREKLESAKYFHNEMKEDFQLGNTIYHEEKSDIENPVELGEKGGKFYYDYSENIAALERVMPEPLEASDISVRLGSTWVDPEYVQKFIVETMRKPSYQEEWYEVHYSPHTSEWRVDGKNNDYRNVLSTATYGTERKNFYEIVEDSLNLRDCRVYDRKNIDGKDVSVINEKQTLLAQEKQKEVKQAFADWIFKDPDRRETLVNKYNVMFNSIRPREYDGSHINFSGINPEIALRKHQVNAIAHGLYGGNTLLAHVVGAGKTFEMAAIAIESKRLGLCNKSLFVVPNHLTEQIGSDIMRLYPSANILVATKKDFEKKNRRRLTAKIATGDYDAVIIGHSQLEKIPISQERQERMIRQQIDEITDGIEQMKYENGDKFTIKNMEKTRKSLETRLTRLIEAPKRDDVVTFEELGIDKMFVDEAHNFKNLYNFTKMRNVAGLQQTEAQKSSDLYMKTQYLDELTGGKGCVFATGTPISNSMVEMHTMMKYLQSDLLDKLELKHFDSWAANYGETTNDLEIAPEGNGYRQRTRFARFFNLPELLSMFKECASIKTADMLNLPVPEATFHNVAVKPTEHQKNMIAELSDRAKAIQQRKVDAKDDNMLCVTNDGRKIGLDQRMMNPMLPDEPGTKVNVCADNVFDIWEKTAEKRSTQLLFCDFSTPKSDGSFNVYDDIRDKLVTRGIPKEEVAFIHEYDTEEKKKALFSKVRNGAVRVLMGSTFKMGAGMNVQDRLIALHDLDCPWRPSDLDQRHGRIIRQGNENEKVDIYRYVTEASFDAYLYQTVENKQKFISQIMTSKSPARSCEDIDEATLTYAEVKALCSGNPLIKEKISLDTEVAKLRASKAEHTNQQYRIEDSVNKHFPELIRKTENRIKGFENDLEHLKTLPAPADKEILPMVIMGQEFTDKEAAGKAIIEACKEVRKKDSLVIGSYKGFDLAVSFDSFNKLFLFELSREMTYSSNLGTDPIGNITRIDNAVKSVPRLLDESKQQLENLNSQLDNAKSELGKPFVHESQLKQKQARLSELNLQLNMDGKEESPVELPLAADSTKQKIVADGVPTIADRAVIRENHTSQTPPKNAPNTIMGKLEAKIAERANRDINKPAPTKEIGKRKSNEAEL